MYFLQKQNPARPGAFSNNKGFFLSYEISHNLFRHILFLLWSVMFLLFTVIIIKLSQVDRDAFATRFDVGVPLDETTKDRNDRVMILYNDAESLPNDEAN